MHDSEIDFLLVTCSMEQSRYEILKNVIHNLQQQAPEIIDSITVFDNASTIEDSNKLLSTFNNVYVSNKNVGYWTAINWWLNNIQTKKFTYIIESDIIHYSFQKIYECEAFLNANDDVGSVRLHEYSVKNRHLYNKDCPTQGSKKSIWQSHTNKCTQKQIEFFETGSDIWKTTFLTQLPSLNRSTALKKCFAKLSEYEKFSELDFQKLYWDEYKLTGILDNGIFNSPDAAYGTKNITGSWTDKNFLQKIGYQETRNSKIVLAEDFEVKKLRKL
jgi:hypothetical protein